MDGVSTDDTLKIAQSYNNSRIRIYSETDKGIYDAMNKGIKKASGNWLYFIGCDDWLLASNTLESIFSMEISKYDIIYGDVEAEHLAPEHSGEWSLAAIDFNRCHQCIFYRKAVFKKVGTYNLDYPVFADFDLNLKWFLSKKIKHQYVEKPRMRSGFPYSIWPLFSTRQTVFRCSMKNIPGPSMISPS